ncbi:MAG: hypothetical protein HYX34_12615 [Actinobacteria bacterium]|nr:hypothetical protein [Actinomycetota bacterium]
MRTGVGWIIAALIAGVALGVGLSNALPERTTVPAARRFLCDGDATWANPSQNPLPTITCTGGQDNGDNVTSYASAIVIVISVAVIGVLTAVVLRLTGPRRRRMMAGPRMPPH